jgi:hypothetical protein
MVAQTVPASVGAVVWIDRRSLPQHDPRAVSAVALIHVAVFA